MPKGRGQDGTTITKTFFERKIGKVLTFEY